MSTVIKIPRWAGKTVKQLYGDRVLASINAGLKVIPLRHRSKIPHQQRWQTAESYIDSADKLEPWLKHKKLWNWGAVTGPVPGIFVLDIDPKSGGFASFDAMIAAHSPLPETLSQTTGSGGKHYFFRWPEDRLVQNSSGKLGAGIDIRGDRGQVVISPSIHPKTRKQYTWDQQPGSVAIAEAPEWLLDLCTTEKKKKVEPLTPEEIQKFREEYQAKAADSGASASAHEAYARAAMREEINNVLCAPHGQRNITLNKAAFSLAQFIPLGLLSYQEIEAELMIAAAAIGHSRGRAMPTIRSGMSKGQMQPRRIPASKAEREPKIIAWSTPAAIVDPETAEVVTPEPEPVYGFHDDEAAEHEKQFGAVLDRIASMPQADFEAATEKHVCDHLNSLPCNTHLPAITVPQGFTTPRTTPETPIPLSDCPEPGSELSQYDREMIRRGRLYACDACRHKPRLFACEDCGRNVGCRRPYPGDQPCRRGPKQLMQSCENVRQGIVLRVSCGWWGCPNCGQRKEYDHLSHLCTWSEEIAKGRLWIPSPDIEDLNRRLVRVSKTAFKFTVTKEHKHILSNHLSKLRRMYGVLWVMRYIGYERFEAYCIVPLVKRRGRWRKIKPGCLNYFGQRGKRLGISFIPEPCHVTEVPAALRHTLEHAGVALNLNRNAWDVCDVEGKTRSHQPVSYCRELRPPKRNRKSDKYKPVGRIWKDDEEAELLAAGAELTGTDPQLVDKSHVRGYNTILWKLTRWLLPDSYTEHKVTTILQKIVEKPWIVPDRDRPPIPKPGRDSQYQKSMFD